MTGRRRMAEPSTVGELVGGFVERLAPLPVRCDSVAAAVEELLPPNMRPHCRFAGVSAGTLKLVVEGASYMYEVQLCKTELLQELQRLCPGARLRRIQVAMTG